MENVIVILLFVGALTYLGNTLRKSFSKKNTGCAKGCGGACEANNMAQRLQNLEKV